MEALLKRELATSVLKSTGHSGGGCISEGQSFDTDTGRVFVKINHKTEARRMFDGEMASLEAILSTNAVKVPRPVKVLDLERSGALLVMEHVDMRSLNKYSSKLGEQLADLHLYNKRQIEKQNKEQQTVGKGPGQSEVETANRFGFHVNTCCGYIPQVNDWQDDWVSFYSQQRLEHQLGLVEQSYGDREARELWSKLQMLRWFQRCCMETSGEEMWPNALMVPSSLTQHRFMAIRSTSWLLPAYFLVLGARFTMLTMRRSPRPLGLQRDSNYTSCSTI
ncbi:ketosamine-3-kinase-like isoform X2 [Pimephales promelas]|nr:ketosamine-3-kinase-like isoform X2 [Pimephales promelas]